MSGKFALIIGNSDYKYKKFRKLFTPAEDAYQFGEILEDKRICFFDDVNILINKPERVLRRAIARFFTQRDKDDLLFLYISGHGVKNDQGELYFACTDTELELISATAIPSYYIRNEMEHSRSFRQILVLDCCFSGAFRNGAKSTVNQKIISKDTFDVGFGKVVLTASNSVEFAWEGNKEMGDARTSIFTQALITGLKTGKADINNDGWISVDEWYEYAYRIVRTSTNEQTPLKLADKVEGNFVFAKNIFYSDQNTISTDRLIGSFYCQLLPDGGIILPQVFIKYYDNGAFLVQGLDRNLMVLPPIVFEIIYNRLMSIDMTDPSARLLRHIILGNALQVNFNSNGSFPLSENLRQYASLEKNIVIIGNGDFVEIWSNNLWDEQIIISKSDQAKMQLQYLLRNFVEEAQKSTNTMTVKSKVIPMEKRKQLYILRRRFQKHIN